MGMRGSGKTTFAKWFIKNIFPNHLVFDTIYKINSKDYAGFNRYQVNNANGGEQLKKEFDDFFFGLQKQEVKGSTFYFSPQGKVIDCIVIEEANLVAPSRETPPLALRFLTNVGRHANLANVCIIRRPTQLHTDVIELADYLIIFALDGKNDIDYLNEIKQGLGDATQKLDIEKHDFIIYKRGHSVQMFTKVTVNEPVLSSTGRT